MRLESDFEGKLEAALIDDAEHRLVGERDNLIARFVGIVHRNLRAYGQRHGYNVEPSIDSLGQPEVDRSAGQLTITVGWEDEQFGRWEFGVPPHRIEGKPLLSFVWSDPPDWVREEFDQARGGGGEFRSGWRVFLPSVDHPGIPESRAIRDSLHGLRRVLRT